MSITLSFCGAGYQNMCRWNFLQLVRHPRIQALDYYCRLDTHSFVRSPLGHDVFDFMAARRLKYGFVVAEEEPAHVITGAPNPIQVPNLNPNRRVRTCVRLHLEALNRMADT